MRQAITTKYLSPTNFKGSRVKASCQAGFIIRHWDHSLDVDENHIAAAKALANKFGWHGEWIGGFNQDSHGVFVLFSSDNSFLVEKSAYENTPDYLKPLIDDQGTLT